MAIIDELGVEVSIHSDGGQAREYDDPNPPDKGTAFTRVCNKYIEVGHEAEFSIHLSVHPGSSSGELWKAGNNIVTFWPYIDGHKRDGRNIRQGGSAGLIEGTTEYSEGSHTATLRRFKFTTVTTVDDTDKTRIERELKVAKTLGLIRVKVWRSYASGDSVYPSSVRFEQNEDFSLAEKSLKGRAVSHGTSYSQAVTVPKPKFQSTNYLDKEPIAIFNFRYKSRQALVSMLIIPRSPSPNTAIEGFSVAEVQRLASEGLQQIKGAKNERDRNRVIKREIGAVFDLTGDDVPPPPLKISKRNDGKDMIDLTDD